MRSNPNTTIDNVGSWLCAVTFTVAAFFLWGWQAVFVIGTLLGFSSAYSHLSWRKIEIAHEANMAGYYNEDPDDKASPPSRADLEEAVNTAWAQLYGENRESMETLRTNDLGAVRDAMRATFRAGYISGYNRGRREA